MKETKSTSDRHDLTSGIDWNDRCFHVFAGACLWAVRRKLRDVVEVRVPGVDAQFEAPGQGRDEAVAGWQRDSLPSELRKNAGRLNEVARFLRLVFPDRHFFLQFRKCL